jgi:hypothetical protein
MIGQTLLHNEELHKLYASRNIIKMMKSRGMRWTRHVASMGEKINAYMVLVAILEGKRQLGRHRHMRRYNIKMHLREEGWRGVD